MVLRCHRMLTRMLRCRGRDTYAPGQQGFRMFLYTRMSASLSPSSDCSTISRQRVDTQLLLRLTGVSTGSLPPKLPGMKLAAILQTINRRDHEGIVLILFLGPDHEHFPVRS